eukprot:TRINITY_DN2554_c0_g1_i1.p1 TRINITY_DN2554_c0_g1~~TRINITY_DN2554_c0_g1_i1.p1  ORF type:complete len:401 (+),score=79.06 TRINITY_DN2554_c0_g1_i1:45-1205(+)
MDSSISFFQDELIGAKADEPSSSLGSSRSRSTSAGSSPACSSLEHPTPKLEAAKAQGLDLPEINYPSPLTVRNTFLDYAERSPKSFAEFLQDRQDQSCPGSKLGAPPGLEGCGSQISEFDEDADFLPTRPEFFDATPMNLAELPDLEYPLPFVVRNTFLDTKEGQNLGSLADFVVERQSKSLPASGIGFPPGLSGVGMGPSSAFDEVLAAIEPRGSSFSLPQAFEPVLSNMQSVALPPPPPIAPPTFPPAAQISDCTSLLMPPAPLQAPQLRIAELLPENRVGTPEMPTVGSFGHHSGTCKPCAFLFTKGCDIGANCSFCHLCPPGEKKRRQKIKHWSAKMKSTIAESGQHAPLLLATATSCGTAQPSSQRGPVYSQGSHLQLCSR